MSSQDDEEWSEGDETPPGSYVGDGFPVGIFMGFRGDAGL